MSRLPIRVRVTLAFAGVMALLLAGLGSFVYLRYQAQVRDAVDQGLRARAAEVSNLLRGGVPRSPEPPDVRTDGFFEPDEGFAVVLTPGGELVQGSSPLADGFTLDPADLRLAKKSPVIGNRRVPGIEGEVRLLATPIEVADRKLIVAVASSLDDRSDAAHSLLRLLAIGGPVALLLASLAGYMAIAAALRPVEAMRRRAQEISVDGGERKLPLSRADDELRRLAQTLNEMLGRLEAAIERERAFVDDASHELRTPLALHKTELELALRYATGPQEMRDALASSVVEVDRLIGLAEDMLVIARSGADPGHPEMLDPGGLLTTLRERFSARAAEDDRDLKIGHVEPSPVWADREQTERALSNLVDNALRHGGGPVVLSARAEGDRVAFHVEDQGAGFPAEFLGRAFERLSRADPARSRGGAGLGLAIVRQIAHSNGGSAGARNRERSGADVWIALPTARP